MKKFFDSNRLALAFIFCAFVAWGATTPTVYGAVLLVTQYATGSIPAGATANKGGLVYDTTVNAERVSNGTEWTSQWRAGSQNGLHNALSENVDGGTGSFQFDTSVATIAAGVPAWNTIWASGGSAVAGVTYLGLIYSQASYRIPIYGMAGVFGVPGVQEIEAPIATAAMGVELVQLAVWPSVAATGAGTFTITITSSLGEGPCNFDFPCSTPVHPSTITASGTCQFQTPSDYWIITQGADTCTTPATLQGSLDLDYFIIGRDVPHYPPNP